MRFKRVRRSDVTLDIDGISQILTGPEVTSMVNAAAQQVASAVRARIPASSRAGRDAEVAVETYIAQGKRLLGKRSAASVAIVSPYGMGIEAKYGSLTGAASVLGVRVRKRRLPSKAKKSLGSTDSVRKTKRAQRSVERRRKTAKHAAPQQRRRIANEPARRAKTHTPATTRKRSRRRIAGERGR